MINKHRSASDGNNNAKNSVKSDKVVPNINLLLVSRDIKQDSQIDKQIAREVNKLTRQVINNSHKDWNKGEKTLGKMCCKLRDAILKRHSTL